MQAHHLEEDSCLRRYGCHSGELLLKLSNDSSSEQIGLTDLEIIPSTAPEDRDKNLGPMVYVLETAIQKAQNVYRAEIDSSKGEPALVIAADTVIATHFGMPASCVYDSF